MHGTQTLGNSRLHLYVTRAATLAFQTYSQQGFEAARRTLSELLLAARPHPPDPGVYLATALSADSAAQLRAYVLEEGGLAVVTKLEVVPLPLREYTPSAYTAVR